MNGAPGDEAAGMDGAPGEVYVIEANPNPWLASSAEFAMAAKKGGYSYTDLINKIVELARARSV